MDLIESIQNQAMDAVVNPDDEAWMRRVFRFYSKRFATPLHLVPQLPLEDVLQAFFEEVFDDMDEEAREDRIEWLLMSPEDRAKRRDTDEKVLGEMDDQFFDKLNEEVSSGETIKRPTGKRSLEATDTQALPAGSEKLAKLIHRTKIRAAKVAGAQIPVAKPKTVEPPMLGDLPEIKMRFGNEGNLGGDAWSELDPLAPPKRQKKT